jgi:hypothetical protein
MLSLLVVVIFILFQCSTAHEINMMREVDNYQREQSRNEYIQCTKKELIRRILFSADLLRSDSIVGFTQALDDSTLYPTKQAYNDEHCMRVAYQSWLIDAPSSLEINLLDTETVCDQLLKQSFNFDSVDGKFLFYPCLRERLFIDALRIETGIEWKTNHDRVPENTFSLPTFYSIDLKRTIHVIQQYEGDMIYENIKNFGYIMQWNSYGLNTSHYSGIKSVGEFQYFHRKYTIESYMKWNDCNSESDLTKLLISYMKNNNVEYAQFINPIRVS